MNLLPVYILNPELNTMQLKDAIAERIHKLQALAHFSQTDDFNEFSEETTANFLWLQSGLLTELSELFTAFVKH